MYFFHRAHVDDGRAVDPKPLSRIEPDLEVRDRQVERVVLCSGRGKHQLIFRVEIRHLGEIDEVHAAAGARRHSHEMLRRLARQHVAHLLEQSRHVASGFDAVHDAIELRQRPRQLRAFDGLQQVVDRVHAERVERVLLGTPS